jgi:hypothetical protein
VSKERSKEGTSKKAKITLVYSKFPFSSEEWIVPAAATGVITGTAEGDLVANSAISDWTTQVAEVCIPLGGWKPYKSPIELLQDHELTYDEVATISVVVTTCPDISEISRLQEAFNASRLNNSVVLIAPTQTFVDAKHWTCVPSDTPGLILMDLTIME